MNLFDPTEWADVTGWFQLMGVCIGTCVLVAVKLAGDRWDDWLERRVGSDAGGDTPFAERWRTRI